MKKFMRGLTGFFTVVVLFFLVINLIPPKKTMQDNPFIINKGASPLIAAHRGGAHLKPENTFKAFDYVVHTVGVDIIEFDLVLTKDEVLVVIHDLTLNRTSDIEELTGSSEEHYVKDFTYQELLNLNFGYKFQDRDGNHPYEELVELDQADRMQVLENERLTIATIDQVFDEYYDTGVLFLIEIKDNGESGKKAADILVDLLTDTARYPNEDMLRRVIIGTFHDQIEAYLGEEYPTVMRGGSETPIKDFIITQMLYVNIFNDTSFHALQIPVARNAFGRRFQLDKATYVNRAHRRGISVQYWTINTRDRMEQLTKLGADVIMTDDPALLMEVLIDMGYRE